MKETIKKYLTQWDAVLLITSLVLVIVWIATKQSTALILITLVVMWLLLGMIEALYNLYILYKQYRDFPDISHDDLLDGVNPIITGKKEKL